MLNTHQPASRARPGSAPPRHSGDLRRGAPPTTSSTPRSSSPTTSSSSSSFFGSEGHLCTGCAPTQATRSAVSPRGCARQCRRWRRGWTRCGASRGALPAGLCCVFFLSVDLRAQHAYTAHGTGLAARNWAGDTQHAPKHAFFESPCVIAFNQPETHTKTNPLPNNPRQKGPTR